jgi:ribosomal protein L37AE/L43A
MNLYTATVHHRDYLLHSPSEQVSQEAGYRTVHWQSVRPCPHCRKPGMLTNGAGTLWCKRCGKAIFGDTSKLPDELRYRLSASAKLN